MSSGYRYFDGRLFTALPPTDGFVFSYLFEHFVGRFIVLLVIRIK